MVFDPNDPRIFVPKRFGIGWTLNFAHPLSYVILVGLVLLVLGIVYIRGQGQGK